MGTQITKKMQKAEMRTARNQYGFMEFMRSASATFIVYRVSGGRKITDVIRPQHTKPRSLRSMSDADYHPAFQQITFVDTETGELQERQRQHCEEAEKFYRELAAQGIKVRVGMEASGQAHWFERLLAKLNVELWIGDAAEIRRKRERKQKTDRLDAQHILRLLLKDDFPRIWVPSWENRDLRQLLWHRHRMVQARTRIMNQLQAVALNEGLRCKKRL